MNNRKKLKKFTDFLYELCCKKNLGLREALEILKGSKEKYLSECGKNLAKELDEGGLFSNGLFKERGIQFDPVYVAFIRFAERTGKISPSLKFLKERCDRREKNVQKIISANLYPFFVIFIAIGLCVFLGIYGQKYFSNEIENTEFLSKLVNLVVGLIIFFLVIFVIIKKLLGDDLLYESFMAVSFMVKSGVSLGIALDYGNLIAGKKTSIGKMFESAKSKVEYGVEIQNAFSYWKIREISDAIFFAQKTGDQTEIFEKICEWLNEKNERKRIICLSVMEPLFICVTGVFLLVLIMSFVMPVITNMSLVI